MIVNNVIWSFVQNISIRIVQFIFGIVLARILSPEDFGVIAICLFFIDLSKVLIEGGLGVSLVRTSSVSEKDYNSVFVFSFLISVVLYILMFLFSDVISIYYEKPLLSILLKVLGVKIIMGSTYITYYSRLRRERNLKLIALITASSSIIGYFFSIISALFGFGVWSLVVMHLSSSFFTVLFYLIKFRSFPKFKFYNSNFKVLFAFGGNLMYSSLVKRFFENINTLVIGKVLSIGDVGIFNRANSLQQIPVQTINASISGGIMPTLYRLQNSKEKMMQLNRQIFKLSMSLTFFVCCYLFLFAKEVTVFVLTEKWIAVVPILKLFAIIGLFSPWFTFFNSYNKVLGDSKILLKIEFVSKIIMFLSLGLIFVYQLEGVLLGVLLSKIVQSSICFFVLTRNEAYSFLNLMEDLKKPFIILVVVFLLMSLFNQYSFNSITLKLFLVTIVGIMAFGCLLFYFFKKDLTNVLKALKK